MQPIITYLPVAPPWGCSLFLSCWSHIIPLHISLMSRPAFVSTLYITWKSFIIFFLYNLVNLILTPSGSAWNKWQTPSEFLNDEVRTYSNILSRLSDDYSYLTPTFKTYRFDDVIQHHPASSGVSSRCSCICQLTQRVEGYHAQPLTKLTVLV